MGFEGFEGQGLRARLCCRRYLTPYFWLYYFTPRWLAGAMPLPKESPKRNIQKEKIEIDKRRKHLFYTFLYYWVKGLTNATSQVVGVVPQTPKHQQHSKNGVVGSTDTAWKREIIWSPFSIGMPFFLLRMRHLFSVRDLWEFLQI